MKSQQRIILLFGLTGCGKSTTTNYLNEYFGWDIISTHEIKARFNFQNTLCEDERNFAYQNLYVECRQKLIQGKSVILDAGFNSMNRRRPILDIASNYGVQYDAIECVCPDFTTVAQRINHRKLDKTNPENQASELETYFHIKKGLEPLSNDEKQFCSSIVYDTFNNKFSFDENCSHDLVKALTDKVSRYTLQLAS